MGRHGWGWGLEFYLGSLKQKFTAASVGARARVGVEGGEGGGDSSGGQACGWSGAGPGSAAILKLTFLGQCSSCEGGQDPRQRGAPQDLCGRLAAV